MDVFLRHLADELDSTKHADDWAAGYLKRRSSELEKESECLRVPTKKVELEEEGRNERERKKCVRLGCWLRETAGLREILDHEFVEAHRLGGISVVLRR